MGGVKGKLARGSQDESKKKKSLEVFGSWVNTLGACQDSVVLSVVNSAFILQKKPMKDFTIGFQQ